MRTIPCGEKQRRRRSLLANACMRAGVSSLIYFCCYSCGNVRLRIVNEPLCGDCLTLFCANGNETNMRVYVQIDTWLGCRAWRQYDKCCDNVLLMRDAFSPVCMENDGWLLYSSTYSVVCLSLFVEYVGPNVQEGSKEDENVSRS